MFHKKQEFLDALTRCFHNADATGFVKLFDTISNEKLIINFQEIPDLKDKIGNLLVLALQSSINTSDFSVLFKILDIANKFDLFKGSPRKELDHEKISENLILENLRDLFGNFSNDFLYFVQEELPNYILKLISFLSPQYLTEVNKQQIKDIRTYVEYNFYLYGFRVRKVAIFDEYLKQYNRNRELFEEGYHSLKIKGIHSPIANRYFFEVLESFEELHVIREDVFKEIIDDYKKNKMVFGYPCISMVMSGGIGPQGKGFAYITPKNEVIEICSDANQNKAYIIEFKKFLKSIFLSKLDEKLQDHSILESLRSEIIDFLDSTIEVELVSLKHVGYIWDKIEAFLNKKLERSLITEDFVSFLKESIYNILVPVKIEDQFKTRMDLIKNNKLSPTDISKLVSLGDISHFDILCQRRFFLIMLENMMEAYSKENKT